MAHPASIEERIGAQYMALSSKLRIAADYAANNPIDVATRSLRSVAEASGVSPATFSRLAKALGYDDYEQLREAGRKAMGQRIVSFSERAQTFRQSSQGQDAETLLHRQAAACRGNIEYLDQSISHAKLEMAVDALHSAKTVLLVGSMGSAGLVEYFGYQAQWFISNWQVAGRYGTSLAADLSRLKSGDAVFALTKSPYAARTIAALSEARALGLNTIAVTDTPTSPALPFADHGFVVPTESPNFFSSYAATMVLLETMMSMLLTRAGSGAEERIRRTEDQVARLGETWTA